MPPRGLPTLPPSFGLSVCFFLSFSLSWVGWSHSFFLFPSASDCLFSFLSLSLRTSRFRYGGERHLTQASTSLPWVDYFILFLSLTSRARYYMWEKKRHPHPHTGPATPQRTPRHTATLRDFKKRGVAGGAGGRRAAPGRREVEGFPDPAAPWLSFPSMRRGNEYD